MSGASEVLCGEALAEIRGGSNLVDPGQDEAVRSCPGGALVIWNKHDGQYSVIAKGERLALSKTRDVDEFCDGARR